MSGRSSAPVESMRRGLSSLRLGTTVGRDPVAMTMRSNVSVSSPPAAVFVTFNVVAFTNAALPDTNVTERCLDNCPSPPVSFLTMLAFHSRSLLRSTLGSPNSMPQFFACSASSSSLATCSRALDGMQPRYRQTPPGFASGSISVTFMPRSAARNAAAYPPGPPPITATRRFEVFAIFLYLSSKFAKPLTAETPRLRRKTRAKRKLGALRVSAVKSPYPCTDSKNGCSNASAIHRRKRAASAPSINR